MRIASCLERRKWVISLDSGPERRVRTPGASDKQESSEVANVKVINGRANDEGCRDAKGRYGSIFAAEASSKVSFSAISVNSR